MIDGYWNEVINRKWQCLIDLKATLIDDVINRKWQCFD
jgi:hypothetical protein